MIDSQSVLSVAEQRRLLEKSLLKLSPMDRHIIILHMYENMSFSEIAQVLRSGEYRIKLRFEASLASIQMLLDEANKQALKAKTN